MTTTLYTCRGKGGTYEYIGIAKGAGTKRQGEHLHVYRDAQSGLLFYRTDGDFTKRMVELVDTTERNEQAKVMEDIILRAGDKAAEALYDAGFRKTAEVDVISVLQKARTLYELWRKEQGYNPLSFDMCNFDTQREWTKKAQTIGAGHE